MTIFLDQSLIRRTPPKCAVNKKINVGPFHRLCIQFHQNLFTRILMFKIYIFLFCLAWSILINGFGFLFWCRCCYFCWYCCCVFFWCCLQFYFFLVFLDFKNIRIFGVIEWVIAQVTFSDLFQLPIERSVESHHLADHCIFQFLALGGNQLLEGGVWCKGALVNCVEKER